MNQLVSYWPIILALVFGLIWLVRLESKVMYMEKDRLKNSDDLKELLAKLHSMEITLTKISSKLEFLNPEE